MVGASRPRTISSPRAPEPDIPDIPGVRGSGYLTSTTAMELDHLPVSMVVLGGGYVAMEQAQLFAHLGTKVTVLVRSRLARREEPEGPWTPPASPSGQIAKSSPVTT